MPDEQGNPLPPLDDKVLDGVSESSELKFVQCSHKDARLVNSCELRCKCGACWVGLEAKELQLLFKKQK